MSDNIIQVEVETEKVIDFVVKYLDVKFMDLSIKDRHLSIERITKALKKSFTALRCDKDDAREIIRLLIRQHLQVEFYGNPYVFRKPPTEIIDALMSVIGIESFLLKLALYKEVDKT